MSREYCTIPYLKMPTVVRLKISTGSESDSSPLLSPGLGHFRVAGSREPRDDMLIGAKQRMAEIPVSQSLPAAFVVKRGLINSFRFMVYAESAALPKQAASYSSDDLNNFVGRIRHRCYRPSTEANSRPPSTLGRSYN